MDQYDYLTRDQLVSLIRALGVGREGDLGRAPDNADGLPEFSERALREFESSSSPMRIFDHETMRYLAVNDAAVKFYGYSREEFLALTLKDTRHPDEHAVQAASLREAGGYLRHAGARRQIRKSGEIVVSEVVIQDVLFEGRKARLTLTIDLTARLRMQELLWQRQQEFESLAENLPDLVARYDRDRCFLYVNSAIEKALEVERGEIVGKTQRELGLPEDLASLYDDSLAGVFATGRPHKFEFRLALPSGERQYETYNVAELDAAGTVGSVLCVARDITERKRIERVLNETNERLHSVIDSSRDCIKVLDLEGRLLAMNAGGQRLLEIDDLAALLDTGWQEFWTGTDRAAAESALEAARRGGAGGFEGYCPTLKGEPRWWDVVVTPILDAAGRPARLLAVSRDITRRKHARDAQSRLAAIVNNSMDAVISKDLDGIIRTWNPAAERMFSYGAEEAVGQPVTMLIPPDRWPEETLILERVRSGVRVEPFESVRCRKDGTRVDVSLSISPIKDAEGKVIGVSKIARDITGRKQSEVAVLRGAALAQLLESLARAANEAVTPEAAMSACLERICAHGGWVIGRVEIFDRGRPEDAPGRSIWHAPERDRFAEFIRITDGHVHDMSGPFIGRVLRERTAVWIEDWRQQSGYRRWEAAARGGLRSAFAFPVIARGEVVAVMEVFSEEVRPRDPHMMGAVQSLASQLARIVEREWAHEVNAKLAAIVESSQDAIISRALDGTILTWNVGAERLLGYTAAEIVGRNLEVLYPPELKSRMFDRQRLVLQGKATPTLETVRLARDGRRIHVSLSSAPIRDSSGEAWGISTIMRDITERKQTELAEHRSAELARLLESLARAANEAVTPEAAMVASLERICQYGRWVLGRVAFYDEGEPRNAPSRSIWHVADRGRFEEFIQISERFVPTPGGQLIARVLRDRAAVWIEDTERGPGFGRRKAALEHGLRSAFAYPVIVRGVVIAVMEFHGEEIRVQDPLIMGAAESIASQLARSVEREWAHQANASLATIVEASQDAIISRAMDGTLLTWNAAAERLFGYTASEAVGRKIEILYPPEIKADMFHKQGLLLRGEVAQTYETVRLAKDGRRIHVTTSPALIKDSSGNICGVSTIIRDITGRKLAEQALWQTQQHLQMAVHGGNVGLWDWDVSAGAVYFSPEWKRQLGYAAHELPNRFEEWESRVHPEDLPRVNAEVKRILEQPQDYQQEYRLRHRDGSYRWILSKASSQVGESGKVERMFGCHVDITAQKQAEAERLENAARQRDALVREVHHRIKNNLQGVIGLLRQKFRKYPAAGPEIEEAITQLQTVAAVYGLQGGRADGLLGLAEMVEAICASAESLIGGDVDRAFERRSARPVCVAGADAVSVAVALNELLFNALKHQPARAGSKRASVLLIEAGGAAEIRIVNRGRLPKEFDYAAGRALGTGLGLVRTLLASPGGDVEFSNGRGRVEVRLKLAPPLLAGRQQWLTRRRNDGGTGKKKIAAARAGRGRRPAGAGRAG